MTPAVGGPRIEQVSGLNVPARTAPPFTPKQD